MLPDAIEYVAFSYLELLSKLPSAILRARELKITLSICEKTHAMMQSEIDQENTGVRKRDMLEGRVLYERFLVVRDLSDETTENVFSTWIAKDLKQFCNVVVVKVRTQPVQSEEKSTRFLDICEALMRLDHLNIEKILECGKLSDGRPYAITAYSPDLSLEQMLRFDRRLELDRAAHIVESAGTALGATHGEAILHYGVNPANIIIEPWEREPNVVRLINFGLANSSPIHFAGLAGKSLFYTAPELLMDNDRETPASDIFSLAAVTYRILTGEVPFNGADRTEILESIKAGVKIRPSELRTDLSANAEAVLLSALQFKSVLRPRDAHSFGRDLAETLREGTRHFSASRQNAKSRNTVGTHFESVGDTTATGVTKTPRGKLQKSPVGRAAVISDRGLVISLIFLLLAGGLSIPIGQTILSYGQKPAAVSSNAMKPANIRLPREIRYSIDGPNTRNGIKIGEYKMTFESDAAGSAYVFSQAADQQGGAVFSVLYPLPSSNEDSAHIEPNQPAKAVAASFNEDQGPNIMWLVWTLGKVSELESVSRTALDSDGIVRDENDIQKLKHFLERNKNNKLDVGKEDINHQIILNGTGDRIVHRINLDRN